MKKQEKNLKSREDFSGLRKCDRNEQRDCNNNLAVKGSERRKSMQLENARMNVNWQ